MEWLALSPDLNPIEYRWNWMKDYLQAKYGDQKFTQRQLHEKVQEAWEVAVTEEELEKLMEDMPKRCRSVIAANGGYTSW